MTDRPPTPPAVALQLRQEAGFGCCVCGYPIIQYHHIVPWEEEHHYRPEDMMALCPNHHDLMRVTPRDKQYDIKRAPYNIVKGYPKGTFRNNSLTAQVHLGNATFFNCPKLIRFEDEDIFSLSRMSDGTIAVNARLYDENDRLLVTITDNEWEDRMKRVWDIKFDHQCLRIRQNKRNILLGIDIYETFIDVNCKLWRNGYCVIGKPNSLFVKKNGHKGYFCGASGNKIHGAYFGFVFARMDWVNPEHPEYPGLILPAGFVINIG